MLVENRSLVSLLENSREISSDKKQEITGLILEKSTKVFPCLISLFNQDECLLRDRIAQIFHLETISHVEPYEEDISQIENLLKRYKVYPLYEDLFSLTLVCCDPSDVNLLASFHFVTNKKIILKVCTYSQFIAVRQTLERIWDNNQINQGLESVLPSSDLSVESLDLTKDLNNDSSPVACLVANIIDQALSLCASDLHFEPQSEGFIIRQRIDGVLEIVSTFPLSHINPINTRLKLMAKMDITEKRRPQDGRIQYKGKQDVVDIRMSSMPTMWGEKLVLRLLSSAKALLKIPQLGMSESQKTLFYRVLGKKQGLILVTGPTGSGKTQTLYAALDWLNHPSVNISTAEDPIEISLKGLNQTQINPVIGYDFAQALKTFLRQDPDIIMLGEIRDQETADICVKASQTGHLVLSTLHTNNAIQSVYRLENLGVSFFNVMTSVRLIIAQRLVRRLCPYCKIACDGEYQANKKGCHHCHHGYKGRIGLYEFLPITPELRELIQKSVDENELLQKAKINLFTSLQEQGNKLIKEGITDINEINRILG